MGDGQHGWAAAEWIMMIRNMFIREEGQRLIIGSGIFAEWLADGEEVSFGPTLTPWGEATVRVVATEAEATVNVDARWRGVSPPIDVELRGFEQLPNAHAGSPITLQRLRGNAEPSTPALSTFAEGVRP
jgi:hypothetical protein